MGDAGKVAASAAIPLKRKAEVNPPGERVKEPRLEQPSATKLSQNRAMKTPTSGLTGQSLSAPRSDQLPYRGTARPTLPMSAPKAPGNPAARTSPSSAAQPPKKGSYQEVLARAKAAQQAAQGIGTIKHKPVEKISKRERERREAEASAKAKQAIGRGSQNGKINGSASTSAKPGEPVKEKKKPVELSYKGTMRPANSTPSSTYKGTMLLSSAPRPAPPRKPVSRLPERSRSTPLPRRPREPNVRYAGYASYSEHESEEEEEEADDVGSEATSDMEATGFDIEEEEMKSLKVARKEDEEAAREEDELKRQKAERKRKLQQMAASAKPRRF